MKLTRELIYKGESSSDGWSKKQLSLLGVEWPPEPGWTLRMEGVEIPDADYAEFVRIKDAHLLETNRARKDTAKHMSNIDEALRAVRLLWKPNHDLAGTSKSMSDICDPIPEDNNADSIRNRQQDADDLAAQRDEAIRTLRERRDWLRARIIAKKSVGWETQYDEREERALTWALVKLEVEKCK